MSFSFATLRVTFRSLRQQRSSVPKDMTGGDIGVAMSHRRIPVELKLEGACYLNNDINLRLLVLDRRAYEGVREKHLLLRRSYGF